jgi:hypothetical protein
MSMRFSPGLVVLCGILLLHSGCSKEPVETVKEVSGVGSTKHGGADCIEGVGMECGMLSFTSHDQFIAVYDCLEEAYEAHLDAFEASWGHLSEDGYNDTADYFGFVDDEPLIDFEGAMGFTSARKELADAEELFLLNGGDPSNSPMLTSPFDNDIMAALFNVYGAVMIDGVIHVVDSEGNQWTFCDCNTYMQWVQDPNSVDPEDDCSMMLKGGVVNYPECKSDWMQKCSHEYTSNKKVNWRLKVKYWQTFDYSTATAQIWHYKKKFGIWLPRRADLYARSHGRYNNSIECVILNSYDVVKAKKRKWLKAQYIPTVQIASYLDKEADGYWEYPSSNYVSMELDYTLPDEGSNCP